MIPKLLFVILLMCFVKNILSADINDKKNGLIVNKGKVSRQRFSRDAGSFQGPVTIPEPPPTPAPVKGAIDYVLLPYIIVGVVAPVFVVVYVVMASIDAKMNPVYLRRSLSEMTEFAERMKPTAEIFIAAISRAIEKEECRQKIACEAGSYVRNSELPNFSWLNSISWDRFVPKSYQSQYRTFLTAVRSSQVNCGHYKCF